MCSGSHTTNTPLDQQLAALLQWLNPAIIWTWLLSSIVGLVYALRLWHRACRDMRRQRQGPANLITAHVAHGNLRRVEVRVLMFVDFVLVGLVALSLVRFPPGTVREVLRLLYVLLLLGVNGLVTLNSWKDEKHYRVLNLLVRTDERPEPPSKRKEP